MATVGNDIAKGMDALAELEATYPGITESLKKWANQHFAALTPKQKTEVITIGGVAVTVISGILVITGHPLEAAEVGTILAGLTFIGHGIQNKILLSYMKR